MTKLFIKNMVCNRCIMAVKIELDKLGTELTDVQLGEMTLKEIAFQLNYSSVAYLSNQFKQITSLSPGHFKKLKENKRKTIDNM